MISIHCAADVFQGVERLYLVGPFMHPGGGVFGAGRATAIKMFEELGMNFEATVGTEHSAGNDSSRAVRIGKAAAPETEGDELVVKGRIFGAMPLTAKIPPEEMRAAFRILSFRRLFFLLSLLFRRPSRKRVK
jgi:hypothetical protein